ncbi:MAG: ABC transporter permease, partial [Blastocatellia bacterium]|nr:ABC transporter permease [Blastocatellia bacterium]
MSGRWRDNLVVSLLLHHPKRTLASILGVAVAMLLAMMTHGLVRGILKERGRREANVGVEILVRERGTAGLTPSGAALTLPETLAATIAEIPGIHGFTLVGQYLQPTGRGLDLRLVEGVTYPEYARLTGLHLVEGRGLKGGDEAIIDVVRARSRRAKVGDTIEIFDRPFRIVGIYAPPLGPRIKIPLETMQRALGAPGRGSAFLVKCARPEDQERIAAELQRRLPNHQVLLTRDLPRLYADGNPLIKGFLTAMLLVAAIVSALLVTLTMYTTVLEQTRQIGILKSLGASKAFIAALVEKQALAISGLGIFLAIALTFLLKAFVDGLTSLRVEMELRWMLAMIAVGLGSGAVGALYP